jgi:hypothetical protein
MSTSWLNVSQPKLGVRNRRGSLVRTTRALRDFQLLRIVVTGAPANLRNAASGRRANHLSTMRKTVKSLLTPAIAYKTDTPVAAS